MAGRASGRQDYWKRAKREKERAVKAEMTFTGERGAGMAGRAGREEDRKGKRQACRQDGRYERWGGTGGQARHAR